MLEVLERFPAIGTIQNYQALPPGERLLYNQYVIMKLEVEAKTPVLNFSLGKKGG